jgi:hypothetical protein
VISSKSEQVVVNPDVTFYPFFEFASDLRDPNAMVTTFITRAAWISVITQALINGIQDGTCSMSFEEMNAKVSKADGFLAALDQSGGSTPKVG